MSPFRRVIGVIFYNAIKVMTEVYRKDKKKKKIRCRLSLSLSVEDESI
jgi:hypothetical protein